MDFFLPERTIANTRVCVRYDRGDRKRYRERRK